MHLYIVNINNKVVDFTSKEKIALIAEAPKNKTKNLKWNILQIYYIVYIQDCFISNK